MIDLYFWPTPNGKKVSIALEEMQLPYNLIPLNIGSGDQFKPEFLKLNPNHRMPAIVDHEPLGGGAPLSIFESGAIMMYLAEKSAKFWPQAPREKYEVAQWVMWQMANQGPKFGECGNFMRAAQKPENGDLKYGLRRFDDEVNRLLGVMNNRLYDRRYLAGEQYSIADMISYPWSLSWERLGQKIDDFKYLKRWIEEVGNRPAVKRGMDVGKELSVDLSALPKEEVARRMKVLSNQRALPAPG